MANTYNKNLSATSLTGEKVVNAQGENIGNLKDIMIDVDRGQIVYGVLDFGGILGVANKLFAVPWQSFSVDRDNHNLILNVDREKLKNANGFDQNDWPDTANPEWGREVHDYYGVTPYWENR